MIRFAYIFLVLSLISCDRKASRSGDDKLLAEAYGERLFLSDISDALTLKLSKVDSTNAIADIVDNWIWEQILYDEAKKNVSNTIELDVLIDNYRRSLYIDAFDNNYLASNLDTSITQIEIDSFLEFHREEFTLPETILRYLFVKIPEEFDDDTLKGYWDTEDVTGLRYYINMNEGMATLNSGEWHYLSELKGILPESIFRKISLTKPNIYSGTDKGSKYYVKIIEIIKDKDGAPVSFLNERVRHRILQQRIKELLKNKKSRLYNSKIKSKQIKIYANADK